MNHPLEMMDKLKHRVHEGSRNLFLVINFKVKLSHVILVPNACSCAVSSPLYKFMGACTDENVFGLFQSFYQRGANLSW